MMPKPKAPGYAPVKLVPVDVLPPEAEEAEADTGEPTAPAAPGAPTVQPLATVVPLSPRLGTEPPPVYIPHPDLVLLAVAFGVGWVVGRFAP